MNNICKDDIGYKLVRSGVIASIGFILASTSAIYTMNLLVPYNPLIRPHASNEQIGQFFCIVEGGIGSAIAFNEKNKTNALQIYNSQQDALLMLEGFPTGSKQSDLLAHINPFASPFDGKRGLFNVTGDFTLDVGGALALRYFIGHGWSINAYLPFYSMRLKNVRWQDLTQHVTPEDQRVHLLLTDMFAANVAQLGNLSIDDWHRAGIGDLAILLDWHRDFPQAKPILKNVAINARAGLSAPTGLKSDQDLIMAVPFGADGAWALPFALGLELTLCYYVQLGLDVQLIHTFGHTHVERIPVMPCQTSLLYLQKACVYHDYGWNQQFSLYAGITELPKGFSASVGYQYIKQGNAKLFPVSNDVSTMIIQESPTLRDWTLHQIIMRADYDCKQWLPDSPVSPRIGFFAQVPFNGKRSILFTTIGGSVSIDF